MRTALAICLMTLSIPARAQDKVDLYGDPLPAGADARLGSTRFRHVNYTSPPLHTNALIFSDNRTLVSQFGGALRFWNAQNGKLQTELDLGELSVACARFSPDRTKIATMTMQTRPDAPVVSHYRTRIWDVTTGKLLTTLSDKKGFTRAVFTADGNTLMTASSGTIELWDVSSGKQLLTFTLGQNEVIQNLDVSPREDQLIAIATGDNVYLWDWLAGKEPIVLTQDQKGYQSANFSPTQPLLAIISREERSIQIWDTVEKKMIHEIRSSEEQPLDFLALTFTPDGQSLICSRSIDPLTERSTILVWDVTSWKLNRTLNFGALRADVLTVSPDSNRLAARDGLYEGYIAVFDLKSGESSAGKLFSHEGPVTSVVFSRDSKVVVTAAEDATVRVWDAETGRQLHRLLHKPGWADEAAISPDGRQIASLNGGNVLHIWDANTGKERHHLPGHGDYGRAFQVAFTPDSKQLLSYGDDLYLRRWDVETGKQLAELEVRPQGFKRPQANRTSAGFGGGRNRLDDANFSGNAERLILTTGNTNHCFHTGTGQEIGTFAGYFYTQAISPDGTQLLTTLTQRTPPAKQANNQDQSERFVEICELPTGREVWRDSVPAKCQIGPVAFSPDGKLIAVGCREPVNEIRIWDVANRKQLLVIADVSNMTYFKNTLAISADNRKLACAQADCSVLIWNLLEEGLPESLIAKPQQQQDEERNSP